MKWVCAALILFTSGCGDALTPIVPASQIVDDSLPESLTGKPGDAEIGAEIFSQRDAGHCVLCHQVKGLTAEFQGNLGPDLTSVGSRLTAGQIRLRIVDYQAVKPGAVMPSYYRRHDLYDVGSEFVGETYLSADDVEDLVAYLAARKE